MSQADSLSARYRSQVADLAAALDANDAEAFRVAFERLRAEYSPGLNPELKRLARSAQQALRKFREQARIDSLVTHEVPDARKRLVHVVRLTNDAAHRCLDLIEMCNPLVERWSDESAQLLEEWNSHGSRELAARSQWPERVLEHFERAVADSERVRRSL